MSSPGGNLQGNPSAVYTLDSAVSTNVQVIRMSATWCPSSGIASSILSSSQHSVVFTEHIKLSSKCVVLSCLSTIYSQSPLLTSGPSYGNPKFICTRRTFDFSPLSGARILTESMLESNADYGPPGRLPLVMYSSRRSCRLAST